MNDEYSWEIKLINAVKNLDKKLDSQKKQIEKKIDENNKQIFAFVDKQVGEVKVQLKEGLNKLWDKKDIDTEKIQDNELGIKENKVRIGIVEVDVKEMKNQSYQSKNKNFYTVLNIIISIVTGLSVGIGVLIIGNIIKP